MNVTICCPLSQDVFPITVCVSNDSLLPHVTFISTCFTQKALVKREAGEQSLRVGQNGQFCSGGAHSSANTVHNVLFFQPKSPCSAGDGTENQVPSWHTGTHLNLTLISPKACDCSSLLPPRYGHCYPPDAWIHLQTLSHSKPKARSAGTTMWNSSDRAV